MQNTVRQGRTTVDQNDFFCALRYIEMLQNFSDGCTFRNVELPIVLQMGGVFSHERIASNLDNHRKNILQSALEQLGNQRDSSCQLRLVDR